MRKIYIISNFLYHLNVLRLTFFVVTFLAFLGYHVSGYAYTDQDVQKCLSDHPAPSGCYNWTENIVVGSDKAVKVWQRCNATNVLWQTRSDLSNPRQCGHLSSCPPYGILYECIFDQYLSYTYCDGTTTPFTYFNSRYFQVDTCYSGCGGCVIDFDGGNVIADYSSNCKSLDTLLCTFIPFDDCQDSCCSVIGSCCPID